jgi:large subunit ribosomal protein L30
MLRIKQVRSSIKCNKKQKRTLKALGLKKVNDIAMHEDNPVIKGMVRKVSHLVEMEEK